MELFDKITSAVGSDDADASSSVGAFDPPPELLEDRVSVTKRTEIIREHYNGVTARQAKLIAETLKRHLEDEAGHRQRDIIDDVEENTDLDRELDETSGRKRRRSTCLNA